MDLDIFQKESGTGRTSGETIDLLEENFMKYSFFLCRRSKTIGQFRPIFFASKELRFSTSELWCYIMSSIWKTIDGRRPENSNLFHNLIAN